MRRRNLRKKAIQDDDTSVPEPPLQAATKKGVLSFDADEEPVVTKVKKKSERKHTVEKKKLQNLVSKPLSSTQISTAGAYTAEKLEELKQQSVGLVKKHVTMQPVLKISGSFKPTGTSEQSPPSEAFVRVTPEVNSQKEAGEKLEEDLEGHFVPPNSQTIEMAKAKRERLRQAQLAPDYLPLGGTSTLLSQDHQQKDERRSSGSDAEEDHMRLQFIGHSSFTPKILHEEADFDLMEDEDAVDSFVDTQIKKGLSALGVSDAHRPKAKKHSSTKDEDEVCVLPVVSRAVLADTAENARDQFIKDMKALEELEAETQQNLKHTKARLHEALHGLECHKEEAMKTEDRYRDVQEMREYVADLCACIKDKTPFIEAMEDHLQDIYDERAKALEEEALEIKEGQELADIASNAILETIAAEGSLEEAAKIAQIAVHNLETTYRSSEDPQMKERAVQRGERRKRRWETALQDSVEGDYNIQRDNQIEDPALSTQLEEMAHTAQDLFSDVLPEMNSIPTITSRFEEWKKQYRKLYQMVYIPDSLPALLAPFVRCEVLTCSPLHGTPLGLETHKWYNDVENFGGQEEEHLVPELVKQIVLPSARKQIQKCWSPFELKRSRVVAEMIRELLVYVPMDDVEMQKLLQLLQQKLKEAAADAGIPPYTRPALSTSETVKSVVEVKFRRALHLIASLLCFMDILPGSLLRDVVLTEIVCEKLLPYLRAAMLHQPRNALQKMMQLLSLIPQSLVSPVHCAVECVQISEVLSALGRTCEKQQKSLEREEVGELISSFVKWLLHFGKQEIASSLQRTFLD